MRQRNVLARRHRGVLERVVGADAVLAFDFDGTLAPITVRPEAAEMRQATHALLADLAAVRRVAIITGRAVADVRPRLHGIRTAAIVGNHGSEPSAAMPRWREAVMGWLPPLVHAVRDLPGVQLEDKGLSVAVHYRHAPSAHAVRSRVLRLVGELGGAVRLVEGIEVVNVIPSGAPNKGDALRRLERQLAARSALYVGDEATDEDAFAVLAGTESVAVRVGWAPHSRAPYYVPDQLAVDALLEQLLARVRRSAAGSRRSPLAQSSGGR